MPSPLKPTQRNSPELITYRFVFNSSAMGYLTLPLEITNRDVERLARYLKSMVISDGDLTDPMRSLENSAGVLAPGEV